jgi:hypothetical protein
VGDWVTAVLLVCGLYLALRKPKYRWLMWSFLWWVLLFVAVTAWKPSVLRAFLTGGWFDDYNRIAAGMVVVELPLALLGFVAICTKAGRGLETISSKASVRKAFSVAPALGLAAIALVVSQHWAVSDAAYHAQSNYNLRPGSPLMSADEFALYKELPGLVPADEVIADNPWDGSAWAYFVSGRRVLFPAILTGTTPDSALLATKLNQAAEDPAVCQAAKRLRVGYAINSDELIYLPGNSSNQKYPGIAGLDHARGFELVAQVGGNRVYKLTACQ